MEVIIKGKRYNTDKATMIGEGSASCPRSDFAFFEEVLYKKRTGEYFIHGHGGPASKYAQLVDHNTWSGGSKIIPLTYAAAMEWAEEHLSAQDYIAEFGDPEPDDDTTEVMTISVPASVAARIRREAQLAGTSISGLIASKFIDNDRA